MDEKPSDTTLDAARREFEILRKLGPEVRAEMVFKLSDNLRDLVEAGIRHRNPSGGSHGANVVSEVDGVPTTIHRANAIFSLQTCRSVFGL